MTDAVVAFKLRKRKEKKSHTHTHIRTFVLTLFSVHLISLWGGYFSLSQYLDWLELPRGNLKSLSWERKREMDGLNKYFSLDRRWKQKEEEDGERERERCIFMNVQWSSEWCEEYFIRFSYLTSVFTWWEEVKVVVAATQVAKRSVRKSHCTCKQTIALDLWFNSSYIATGIGNKVREVEGVWDENEKMSL